MEESITGLINSKDEKREWVSSKIKNI